MKIRNILLAPALYCIASLLSPGMARADLINGGFETGSFSSWTVLLAPELTNTDYPGHLGPEGAVSVVAGLPNGLPAAEGQYCAEIISPLYCTTSPSQVTTSISREIYLAAGDHLSGSAAFYNNDFGGMDTSWVKIYSDGTEVANPWYAYSGGFAQPPGYACGYGYLTNRQTSPWISWDWTAPSTGVYTLELATQSLVPSGDSFESFVYFDNITVTVPEPSTFALAGLAAVALMLFRHRK